MPAVNFRPMKIGIWIIADEKSPLHGGLVKFGLPHPSNAKCVMITVKSFIQFEFANQTTGDSI